jgi:hypothetical protein
MTYEIPGKTVTLPAGEDLSGFQFRFVTLQADGNVDASAADDGAIGVLQNKPAAVGRAATVMTDGVSKVEVGTGDVTAGDRVVCVDATTNRGRITVADDTADEFVVGIALADGAAGELVPVQIITGGTVDSAA